ncbi:D-hexose-6-phosphate mutarotase [Niveibacterium umoris]|uniref:Putative glucose-6-phosphate 1-epimerase n=1 Tax=Niveibacterium umoris TaxID=1193620 RepID=A0A840BE44_9RHOO|nr:D-hexose-6-phosphate mutarotase [Niveibacterium umoris]MBB4011811.1 glucose-6-phosphate 1-epimerase [Niveibacterium umoris]
MSDAVQHLDFNGLPAIRITAPNGAQATILQHGAQVVSWIPAGGEERLFLSERARFEPGVPVRGGIPICFPQFGSRGPLPKHGFVRTVSWDIESARAGSDFATATLVLNDDDVSRAIWPHAFRAELTVLISGQRMDVELGVSNPGDEPLRFTCALHSYLATREVEEARVEGLRGLRYLDAVRGTEHKESGTELMIEAETDRIYFEAAKPIMLAEPRRALGISGENLPDVVVWNPWEHLSATLPDMTPLGFRRMLCIEHGAIGRPVELAPGAEWWGRQSLVVL